MYTWRLPGDEGPSRPSQAGTPFGGPETVYLVARGVAASVPESRLGISRAGPMPKADLGQTSAQRPQPVQLLASQMTDAPLMTNAP